MWTSSCNTVLLHSETNWVSRNSVYRCERFCAIHTDDVLIRWNSQTAHIFLTVYFTILRCALNNPLNEYAVHQWKRKDGWFLLPFVINTLYWQTHFFLARRPWTRLSQTSRFLLRWYLKKNRFSIISHSVVCTQNHEQKNSFEICEFVWIEMHWAGNGNSNKFLLNISTRNSIDLHSTRARRSICRID